MAFPQADVDRIQAWCSGLWPEHLRDQARVEADIAARHIDIVEVRPPWDGMGGGARSPIARLRYTASTGLWSIYWCDRNLVFHEYRHERPTKNVQSLLDHIGSHNDPIFFG